MKHFLVFLLLIGLNSFAQPFKFAQVTDTHIGNLTGADDLRRTVQDINNNPDIAFVILSGDITEFGADDELFLAKQILDSLNKPYHVIPGNHDTNWSESGGNTFLTTFKSGTFSFTYNGYHFLGTGSGPYMRMGPGQIPREDVVWLDSILNTIENRAPIIYINHYPQDSSLNNWYSTIDLLKEKNIQLMLCGHGHKNKEYRFEGIPNIMGRSNLRAKDNVGGYNIISINHEEAMFTTKKPLTTIENTWLKVALKDYNFHQNNQNYPRPSFQVNQQYPQVKVKWEFQDNSDIGVGIDIFKNLLISANTKGEIYAISKSKGLKKWSYKTNGKIYSTPYVYKNDVFVGSTDGNIYCLNAKNGVLKWKHQTSKAILSSPIVADGKLYFGDSDGHFRALFIKNGALAWDYPNIKGFVVAKPLIYNGKIYFGSWGNYFYALDAQTGKEVWKWTNGSANRMFSPAACQPVAANGKVFIVAPDRYMTAFDAESGAVVWRKTLPDNRVRESLGLSEDGMIVYAKTMDGKIFGVATTANDFKITWQSPLQLPYELNPATIISFKDKVFVPTHSGLAVALNQKDGSVLWKYKTSNCLINTIKPSNKKEVLVSTMDGKITCLKY